DFAPKMKGERVEPMNGTKVMPQIRWASRAVTEGASPCEAAREVIAQWLKTRQTLWPPRRFDRRYDTRGGAFVSLRRRDDIHHRPARQGFWHFPEERGGGPGKDLVLAAVQTAWELSEK